MNDSEKGEINVTEKAEWKRKDWGCKRSGDSLSPSSLLGDIVDAKNHEAACDPKQFSSVLTPTEG